MFLVQSQTADGRLFYAYITGHEARLAKRWCSVIDSLPNSLTFQGLPTMSFDRDTGNYTRARWTTSKVMLTKLRSDTYVKLADQQGGNLFTEPRWVRSVQLILQDNPQYQATSFTAEYCPVLLLDTIRPRPTNFKWTPGTLIQLTQIEDYPNPPVPDQPLEVVDLSKDPKRDRDDSDNPPPKRSKLSRSRRNTAA